MSGGSVIVLCAVLGVATCQLPGLGVGGCSIIPLGQCLLPLRTSWGELGQPLADVLEPIMMAGGIAAYTDANGASDGGEINGGRRRTKRDVNNVRDLDTLADDVNLRDVISRKRRAPKPGRGRSGTGDSEVTTTTTRPGRGSRPGSANNAGVNEDATETTAMPTVPVPLPLPTEASSNTTGLTSGAGGNGGGGASAIYPIPDISPQPLEQIKTVGSIDFTQACSDIADVQSIVSCIELGVSCAGEAEMEFYTTLLQNYLAKLQPYCSEECNNLATRYETIRSCTNLQLENSPGPGTTLTERMWVKVCQLYTTTLECYESNGGSCTLLQGHIDQSVAKYKAIGLEEKCEGVDTATTTGASTTKKVGGLPFFPGFPGGGQATTTTTTTTTTTVVPPSDLEVRCMQRMNEARALLAKGEMMVLTEEDKECPEQMMIALNSMGITFPPTTTLDPRFAGSGMGSGSGSGGSRGGSESGSGSGSGSGSRPTRRPPPTRTTGTTMESSPDRGATTTGQMQFDTSTRKPGATIITPSSILMSTLSFSVSCINWEDRWQTYMTKCFEEFKRELKDLNFLQHNNVARNHHPACSHYDIYISCNQRIIANCSYLLLKQEELFKDHSANAQLMERVVDICYSGARPTPATPSRAECDPSCICNMGCPGGDLTMARITCEAMPGCDDRTCECPFGSNVRYNGRCGVYYPLDDPSCDKSEGAPNTCDASCYCSLGCPGADLNFARMTCEHVAGCDDWCECPYGSDMRYNGRCGVYVSHDDPLCGRDDGDGKFHSSEDINDIGTDETEADDKEAVIAAVTGVAAGVTTIISSVFMFFQKLM